MAWKSMGSPNILTQCLTMGLDLRQEGCLVSLRKQDPAPRSHQRSPRPEAGMEDRLPAASQFYSSLIPAHFYLATHVKVAGSCLYERERDFSLNQAFAILFLIFVCSQIESCLILHGSDRASRRERPIKTMGKMEQWVETHNC